MSVVGVLDYGMGNLRSVTKALAHVGAEPRLVDSPSDSEGLAALVVPGVGAFGACMEGLRERGHDGLIREWADAGRPLLGVCLGMQLLFEWSEEGGVEGLGLLPGKVRRIGAGVKVPHMGWNEVEWVRDHPVFAGITSGTRFYFVHSYACDAEAGDVVGDSDHGGRFAAVVARGAIVATQFHPEKSGAPGLEIYRAFVEDAG